MRADAGPDQPSRVATPTFKKPRASNVRFTPILAGRRNVSGAKASWDLRFNRGVFSNVGLPYFVWRRHAGGVSSGLRLDKFGSMEFESPESGSPERSTCVAVWLLGVISPLQNGDTSGRIYGRCEAGCVGGYGAGGCCYSPG